MSAVPGFDRIRAARKQVRAGAALVDAVRKDPRIARDLVAGLLGAGAAPSPAPARELPPGLAEFAKSAHAEQAMAAPVEAVWAYLCDLDRLGEWFTLHSGWRGAPPGAVRPGLEFTQQAQVMGLPVDIRWRVAAVGEHGFELHGQAPQQVRLGYWITVSDTGSGTLVSFDAGVAGPPIEGPLGGSVTRSLGDAMTQSLARLPGAIAAAGPLRPRVAREPVYHRASGRELDPRTPVLVGVGQFVGRTPDPDADPAELAARALRRAAEDAGPGAPLLRRAQAVFAVACTSWQYRDLGAAVAERVGAERVDTVQSSPFGGDGGQLVINEAAAAIAAGDYEIVLVTGAEAGATQAAAQRAGREPGWPVQDGAVAPTRTVGIDRPANNAAETAAGLIAPINMYALLESANRHRLGRGVAEHATAIAELWSRLSAVAAGNEYAWQPEQLSAAQIAAVSADNRMVSTPYTKLECANLSVDMASGIVVCSAAAAEAAGIAQDRWVFLHAGASGHDEWFTSERAELAASPAIRTLGAAALAHAGITAAELAHVDLYACFPVAVQIAARELGLPTDDPARPLSVTGGLTFGGGPGNNYGGHAVATLVRRLRADPGSYGLSTSLGWYVTKHALGVYSTHPPRQPYRHLTPVIDHPPARPARSGAEGPAVVEAYTVAYTREEVPEAAVLSLITPSGERNLVRATDSETITACLERDLLGLPVTVSGEGVRIDGATPVPLPAPPEPPVLVERRGPVTIITVNRPQVRNAINLAAALGIERALDAFEADAAAQVAIITGAGGYFSAGMDLKAAARGEVPMTEGRGPLGIAARPPVKPLIAAVEGPALAGGCELALSADLVVAARDSSFGIPEVKRGLVAVGGGVLRLAQRLPRAIAMELALTGDPVTATRAAELGLVNQVVDPGRALDAALELAQRIAVNAPLSIAASKTIIDSCPDWSSAESFIRQGEAAAAALSSEDAAEGVLAFAQKRAPVWKGR
ncbi:crotonase/enoyl-CoA hydratase family protein [Nocardia sp. CDC159]|uniref:Crotonase/enoyl-CoA hydratase family protein n=1 Tax=Nocardia pulmonis TaxID=2951408 RepID=A0A9X2E1F5_9NOCA|nr:MULTISPECIES: crotonase/enoyl-CoA hydratase family protein [Nocardia]MCM6772452.1 crotonase/enoyl-CoA hydratase family protein [Nocardia pulmonis]MCM6784890.1 crotonase/enoyl-CoA hydratase family protein [Nocardia sp. CDC159]